LTGATADRQAAVDTFQGGKAEVFLISLKAGGTGLTLTRADTVIHYDPWWNPAAQAQATDRAYRIGQTRPVFVYRLIAAGSVEERMLRLQQRKRELAQGLLADSGGVSLTAGEVEELLAPLADD
jgi:SNF2 family DNA or RNA helicase